MGLPTAPKQPLLFISCIHEWLSWILRASWEVEMPHGAPSIITYMATRIYLPQLPNLLLVRSLKYKFGGWMVNQTFPDPTCIPRQPARIFIRFSYIGCFFIWIYFCYLDRQISWEILVKFEFATMILINHWILRLSNFYDARFSRNFWSVNQGLDLVSIFWNVADFLESLRKGNMLTIIRPPEMLQKSYRILLGH